MGKKLKDRDYKYQNSGINNNIVMVFCANCGSCYEFETSFVNDHDYSSISSCPDCGSYNSI